MLYFSDVFQEGSLVATEFDPLWPWKAAAGLHSLSLQWGQASGKDSLPWNREGGRGDSKVSITKDNVQLRFLETTHSKWLQKVMLENARLQSNQAYIDVPKHEHDSVGITLLYKRGLPPQHTGFC